MIRAAIAGLGRWGRNLVEASLGHERLKIVRAVEPELVKQTIAAALTVRTISLAARAMASLVVASGRVSVKWTRA